MEYTYATDVANARAAYDALLPAQKSLVTNLATLTAAEKGIVSDITELTTALADLTVNQIFITDNITFASDVIVNRAVMINGNYKSFILTGTAHRLLVQAPGFVLSNTTVTGSTEYNVVVQDTTSAVNNNAVFSNVTFSNSGKGGLLVLNSSATIENITTSGNNWGGIQLAQKSAGNPVGKPSVLKVVGTHTHIKPVLGVDTDGVAVWSHDDVNTVSSITGETSQYTPVVVDPTKTHYKK